MTFEGRRLAANYAARRGLLISGSLSSSKQESRNQRQAAESGMTCLQRDVSILPSPGKEMAVKRRERGFSMLELIIAIFIGMVATTMTFLTLLPMLKQQSVTTGYNDTLTAMRRARDQAAADMRVYVVTFTAPGTITVTQNTTTGPILITVTLPQDITFHVE